MDKIKSMFLEKWDSLDIDQQYLVCAVGGFVFALVACWLAS